MKTKFIQEINKIHAVDTGRREVRHEPLSPVSFESSTVPAEYHNDSIYRIEARFGYSLRVCEPIARIPEITEQYRHHLADHIYGQVTHELRQLLPHVHMLPYSEERQHIADKLGEIIMSMRP